MLASLAACGKTAGEVQTGDTSDTTAADTTAYTLPEKDMGGWEVSILNSTADSLSWANTRILIEEQNGEILNDAIYNRNAELMEKYNFVLEVDEERFVDVPARLQSNVMADDDAYQIYSMNEGNILAFLPYISDWDNIPGMSLDREWWNPNATSVYNIEGKQTALAGNMTLSAVSRAVCMVFNKKIWETYGDPNTNLYELVHDNQWTVEKYLQIASSVSDDLNGDGNMDGNDLYGLNMGRGFKGYIAFFLTSAGIDFTDVEDGRHTFTFAGNETGVDLMTKLVDAMGQEGYYYNEDTTVHGFLPGDFFKNGHALFTMGVPHDIYKLRDMNDDIGILPMPKMDENQKEYKTASCGGAVWTLSKTFDLSLAENMGIILEAMSYKTYNDVIPIYKETALKTKTARDNESAAMLDIIWSDLYFTFGMNLLYDQVIAEKFIGKIWDAKSSDTIVSSAASSLTMVESVISDIYEQVAEME